MALASSQTAATSAPRRVTILGSTGSIGVNTLDLIGRQSEFFEIEAMTAHRNVARLAEQARRFQPKVAVVADPESYGALKDALSGSGIEVAAGTKAVSEAAQRPADWVMAAIVGAAGLPATLEAIRRGVVVALANKETLVCAGALMTAEVTRHKATLLPVDSEHNAIFQVLDLERPETVDRIVLTASGGPFRTASHEAMERATPKEAIAHPNWEMGPKISVDSATMMNKGLEVIEASYLFGLPAERVEVLVHPQSVVHSLVAYIDGSVLAQLGQPDMRTPIAYTLAWPGRMTVPVRRLDLAEVGTLTFERPDPERFPALGLARQALASGGTAPTVLNAANEIAVGGFLAGRLGFLAIAEVVAETLDRTTLGPLSGLEAVVEADRHARLLAREVMAGRA